jgi:signal transduction histidine kinase
MTPSQHDDGLQRILEAAAGNGLDAFLDAVLEEGLRAVGATQGSLMLRNMRSDILEIIQQRGPLYDPKRKHRRFKVGEGIAGRAAEECKPYLIHDVTLAPHFIPARGELNFRSLMAVPITREGRAIGVICADSPEAQKFDERHIETLSRLAQTFGVAIEHLAVDTFISHVRRLKQLESLHEVGQELSRLTFESSAQLPKLLEQIAKDAERVLEADLVTLYQYYEQNDRFEAPPTRSGDFNHPEWMIARVHSGDAPDRIVKMGIPHYSKTALTDKIMRAGEIVPAGDRLPERPSFVDREKVVSSAGIPLRAGQETVGVMFINYRTQHAFLDEEKYVIETFAAYAALAIQGARRFREALRLREEALRQSSGSVAHRLRNILPVISGRIDRTLRRGHLTGQGIAWCREALKETHRAQRIVGDFLTFSRAEVFERPNILSAAQLGQKLGDITRQNLTQADAKVDLHVDPNLPFVRVNLDRLGDDFANFVRDSERHKPSGLCITVVCELAVDADIQRVGLRSGSPYVKLIYADNGPGVAPEFKQRIFEAFYATAGGTGLGLAMAKHNAKIHDGDLVECGKLGQGIQFELYILATKVL